MPSPITIIIAIVVCGFAASFLSRWLLQGPLDLTRNKTSVLILVGLAVLCYVNSFGNGFVWDDSILILQNSSLRNWQDWTKDFTRDLYNNPVTHTFYYRPLQSLSYRIDYTMWGLYPDGYHGLNIALHAANSVLVFFLVRRFLANAHLALAVAALFAVHPIHTQAVTYISGRADPMCAFFLLLSFGMYDRGRSNPGGRSWPWFAGAVLAYAGALGSKEFAACFPVLLIAYEIGMRPGNGKSPAGAIAWRLVPFVLVLGAWISLRKSIFEGMAAPDPSSATAFSPVLLCLRALGAYVSLLVAPLILYMERTVAFADWKGSQLTVTGVIVAVAIVVLLVVYWKRSRAVALGLLWFLIFFLPISNLWPLNATLAEHWMYFPSIGFLWASCAILFDLLSRWRVTSSRVAGVGTTIVVFLVLLFGTRTVLRNLDWRDEITFYARNIQAGGVSARIHNNLGMALIEKRNDEVRAEQEFKAALQLDPQYDPAIINLGLLYLNQEKYDPAVMQFRRAIEVRPWREEAWINLATAYGRMGRMDDAWKAFEEAVAKFPQSPQVAFRYGLFALHHKRLDLAEAQLRRGEQLAPSSSDFPNALGGVFIEKEDAGKAVECLTRAKQLDPFNTNPYLNLSLLHQRRGEYAEAEQELLGALKLEGYNPDLHHRLGLLYWRAGQTAEAGRALGRALELYPDFAAASNALAKVASGQTFTTQAVESVIGLTLLESAVSKGTNPPPHSAAPDHR